MKFVKVLSIILGILMIASGLYCLTVPALTFLGIGGYVVGAAMLLDAISRIHAWWQYRKTGDADGWMLAGGILSCIVGLVLIVNDVAKLQWAAFVVYMVGIWILIRGIITIIRAFRARKFHKTYETSFIGKNWWIRAIIGVLMCVFGIMSLWHPDLTMATIGTFIALGIIVAGCETITIALTPKEAY